MTHFREEARIAITDAHCGRSNIQSRAVRWKATARRPCRPRDTTGRAAGTFAGSATLTRQQHPASARPQGKSRQGTNSSATA